MYSVMTRFEYAEWVTVALHSSFWISAEEWLQRWLVVTWLVTRETAVVLAQVLCTSYSHSPVYSLSLVRLVFISTRKLYIFSMRKSLFLCETGVLRLWKRCHFITVKRTAFYLWEKKCFVSFYVQGRHNKQKNNNGRIVSVYTEVTSVYWNYFKNTQAKPIDTS